jgi:collagenase-like PrtC family protease
MPGLFSSSVMPDMLINCPIKNSEEAVPLIAAGADCFYGGVSGSLLFGSDGAPASRRPWDFASFTTLHDFHEALSLIHKHGRTFHLTLNAHCYSGPQIEAIVDFLEASPPMDGLIVADINLIIVLRLYPGRKHGYERSERQGSRILPGAGYFRNGPAPAPDRR